MRQTTPLWFSAISHSLPWLLFGYMVFVTITDPSLMVLYTTKDHVEGGGLIENLTVLVLIPGIIFGLLFFIRNRSQMQPSWTAYWLLAWILSCVYFAGEEISWGQWYFEWETPQAFSEINDQNETNLHNTSTWLDQKPRTLVELWIFLGGLILPLFELVFKKTVTTGWKQWIFPLPALMSAAMIFTLVRFAGWSDIYEIRELLGSSEFRELCIALFLSLFLISYPARKKQSS